MNWARHAAGLSDRPDRFPTKATCLSIYSRVVNFLQAPLAKTLGRHFPWAAAHEEALRGLFAGYVEAKQRQSVLDYDDLLLYFCEKRSPSLKSPREIASRFDHLLVDEYQDTNRLQAEIALRLRPRGRGLTVVGDDAQSIYSFRAATVRNILDFPQGFRPAGPRGHPGSQSSLDEADPRRVKRRDRPQLQALGQGPQDLIAAPGAIPRLVTTGEEADQARYVATRVLENREAGGTLKSQAVLFRAAHHSAALELELTRATCRSSSMAGSNFSTRRISRSLAALRFAENPRDRVAGFRAANAAGNRPGERGKDRRRGGGRRRLRNAANVAPPAKARADFAYFVAAARTGSAGGLAGRSCRSRRLAARTSRRRFRQLRHAGSRSRRISSGSRRPIPRANVSSAS